jgi:hypothetical protein
VSYTPILPIKRTHNVFRIPIEPGRSASPYPGSENGNVSDDNSNGKGKAKGKGKRAGNCFLLIRERFDKHVVDDADFNLKRKRVGMAQLLFDPNLNCYYSSPYHLRHHQRKSPRRNLKQQVTLTYSLHFLLVI